MRKRASGILCHITSLPSPYGIGDIGPGAYAFADMLVRARQTYWQVLPINPTSEAKLNSPYNTLSAFAGNTNLISPDLLVEDGYLEKKALPEYPASLQERVDYREVTKFKQNLFAKAHQNFVKKGDHTGFYEEFCQLNDYWLEDHALHKVLRQQYEGKELSQWPKTFRDRDTETLRKVKADLRDQIEQEKFLQYMFSRQWRRLKNYCNNQGIQIIGDHAHFMDCDSADVWAHPDYFKLDGNKRSLAEAGAPPDQFAAQGQLFNCSVYNWDGLKRDGFSWWIARYKRLLQLFDIIRIDHFRGFVAYWEVPPGGKNALKGKWQPAPYYEFMETLCKHVPSLPFFAEDLGLMSADVREAMAAYGIPGIRMVLDAFSKESRDKDYLPHNHVADCVVFTGTHDTNTCIGWYEKEDNPEDKAWFEEYTGHKPDPRVNWELIRMAMMSVARTAIIPMQDILGLGVESRMNTPTKSEGNWQWRLKPEQLGSDAVKRFAEMTELYDRV